MSEGRTKRFWKDGKVLLHEDGSVDEVVCSNVTTFHLEQMDDDAWWLGLYGANGRVDIQFRRKGKRILVSVADVDRGTVSEGFPAKKNK